MGILNSIFGRRQGAEGGQYIPANETALTRTGNALRDSGNAMLDSGSAMLNRAGRFYKENPRKVQALGLLAGAILLSRMKRGR